MALTQLAPARALQSFRHEAWLWRDAADFTTALVPFIVDGLASGEPVMVAVGPEHTEWLRNGLGKQFEDVLFVDMTLVGRNPNLLIDVWQRFLESRPGQTGPARGIGEPVWPGRSTAEVEECQLHEALLNVAIDPDIPFWLVCPYDLEGLDPAVVDEARRSHPMTLEAGSYLPSPHYAGRAHADSLFAAELAELGGAPHECTVNASDTGRLHTYLKLEFWVNGLALDQATHLAGAVEELVQHSLHRGAQTVTVRSWSQRHALICEVSDDRLVDDPLHGRSLPRGGDHDGLWRANQACDLVQLRSNSTGTIIRTYTWK